MGISIASFVWVVAQASCREVTLSSSTFLPGAGAAWSEEDERLRIAVPIHGEDVEASLRVGPASELRDIHLNRWSDLTDDRAYTLIPFAMKVEAERPFGDYTIPSQLRSAWWAGTSREFEFFRPAGGEARPQILSPQLVDRYPPRVEVVSMDRDPAIPVPCCPDCPPDCW